MVTLYEPLRNCLNIAGAGSAGPVDTGSVAPCHILSRLVCPDSDGRKVVLNTDNHGKSHPYYFHGLSF